MLQRVAACGSVGQRVAACCSMLQRVAACCSVLQCTNIIRLNEHRTPIPSTEGAVTVCCSVLQLVAACCSAHILTDQTSPESRSHLWTAWGRKYAATAAAQHTAHAPARGRKEGAGQKTHCKWAENTLQQLQCVVQLLGRAWSRRENTWV